MSTNGDVLRTIPLFRGLTDQSIETISHLAVPASFAAGDVLVRESEPGDSFIVLIAGQATVEKDGQSIRSLTVGDFEPVSAQTTISRGRGRGGLGVCRPTRRAMFL